jgi:hypothetical protein
MGELKPEIEEAEEEEEVYSRSGLQERIALVARALAAIARTPGLIPLSLGG